MKISVKPADVQNKILLLEGLLCDYIPTVEGWEEKQRVKGLEEQLEASEKRIKDALKYSETIRSDMITLVHMMDESRSQYRLTKTEQVEHIISKYTGRYAARPVIAEGWVAPIESKFAVMRKQDLTLMQELKEHLRKLKALHSKINLVMCETVELEADEVDVIHHAKNFFEYLEGKEWEDV